MKRSRDGSACVCFQPRRRDGGVGWGGGPTRSDAHTRTHTADTNQSVSQRPGGGEFLLFRRHCRASPSVRLPGKSPHGRCLHQPCARRTHVCVVWSSRACAPVCRLTHHAQHPRAHFLHVRVRERAREREGGGVIRTLGEASDRLVMATASAAGMEAVRGVSGGPAGSRDSCCTTTRCLEALREY